MATPESDVTKSPNRNKRIKIVTLIIIAAALFLVTLILYFIPPVIPDFVFATLLILTFLDILMIVWFSIRYYNIGIAFLVMIIIAIFFKRMRWPVSSILYTIGFTGLAGFSIVFARIFLKRFNHIIFLKYVGFSSSIILSMVSMGLLWKNMHWPVANVILNTGLVLFIPFLFAFVFTLPSSDYINWNKSERIIFFRAIIIPMAFVYIMVVIMFVFPRIYTSITRLPLIPFDMVKIDLLNKPGLY
jgi:hypothetical protein